MFENPKRGRQERNFTTNAPKIIDLKSFSEQIFSRKLPLGAPDKIHCKLMREVFVCMKYNLTTIKIYFKQGRKFKFLCQTGLKYSKIVFKY